MVCVFMVRPNRLIRSIVVHLTFRCAAFGTFSSYAVWRNCAPIATTTKRSKSEIAWPVSNRINKFCSSKSNFKIAIKCFSVRCRQRRRIGTCFWCADGRSSNCIDMLVNLIDFGSIEDSKTHSVGCWMLVQSTKTIWFGFLVLHKLECLMSLIVRRCDWWRFALH